MDVNKLVTILLIILQIPSFCCAVYIFFQFAQRRNPLRRLQNHSLLCLLIIATWTIGIELPNTQKYFLSGSATIQTSWFCVLWNISFLSTATLNRTFMAFMCVQRHFLVFHSQFYRTHRSRLLFHYIPLVVLISFVLIYLFVTNIFLSCPSNVFDYSDFMCGYTCGVLLRSFGLAYTWIFVFTPTIITVVGCISLPIRFIIQKRQLQRVQWNRARKMIVQTSTIAGAYIICWLPYTILLQLALYNLLSFEDPDVNRYIAFVPYITSLLTPFIVLHTISGEMNLGLIERMKRRFFPQHQGAVGPVANVVAQQVNQFAIEDRNPIEQ
jgi:hypothetical protein